MKQWGNRGLACVALGLILVLSGPAAAQDPDESIGGVVSEGPDAPGAPFGGVVLAESVEPPGMVVEAPIEPGPNTYMFRGLHPGAWRFTVPGWWFHEYVLDGVRIDDVPEAPFTSPIDVPPPGAPRSLDLPVVLPGAHGDELYAAALPHGETLPPNTIAGVVARALGRDSVGCESILFAPHEFVPNVSVRLEILESGASRVTTTDADGRFLVPLPDVGTPRTVRVTVLGAIDVCADVVYPPTTGESVDLVVPPPNGARVGFELPGRLGVVKGIAFYDQPPKNGALDPGEPPAPGVTVTMRRAGETSVRETTTASDGYYAFEDVYEGVYVVTASGPQAAAPYSRVVLMYGATASTGDLPLGVPACCLDGDLHAFLVGTALWVGDVGHPAYEILARLRDGPGRRSRLLDEVCAYVPADGSFTDHAVGYNDVLSIVGFQVVEGWAVVVVRVAASVNVFPAGFFGDVERRLEVKIGNRRHRGVAAFTCAAIRPGAWFTAGPAYVPPGCGGPINPTLDRLLDPPATSPRARFLVLATIPWELWRNLNPPGPCRAVSEDGEGDFQRVDLRIDYWAPYRAKKRNVFAARIVGGERFADRVRIRFAGDLWTGKAYGKNRRLVVTRIERRVGSGWHAHVHLIAPDRPDGNPGSLPAWELGVRTQLNGVTREAWLDLAGALEKEQVFGWAGDLLYEVIGWRTTRDAAACR